jgi:biotin carboxyl carrier protein
MSAFTTLPGPAIAAPTMRPSAAADRVRAYEAAQAAAMPSQTQAALAQVVHLQAGLLSHQALQPAAIQLVSDLAQATASERVSLGLLRGGRLRLVALSHGGSEEFRGTAARELEAAMDEALDQEAAVVLPQSQDASPRIAFAHGALLARGIGALATFPLHAHGSPLGAVTLEWRFPQAQTGIDLPQLETQLALLAPILALLARSELPLRARLAARVGAAWQASTARRRAVLLVVAVASLAALGWPGTLQLAGQARVEGAIQRSITAPADGFVKTVHVRPGDTTEAGQPLLELAEQDLRLDAQRLAGELAQHESAGLAALARSDRAEMGMHLGRAEEARAQLALVSGRIGRMRIEAPFAGVVIDGDLTRSVGAPVKRGEVLLTVAPRDGYRVMIQLDERDIERVRAGQSAALALSALPWDSVPLEVTRVTPVARAVDGANVFEVEARPKGNGTVLRPGMTGVARVAVGHESLGLTAGRRVLDWLRLHWWRWGF